MYAIRSYYVIFYYGYTSFRELRTMPDDAFAVDVLGKRWSWTFTYPNGKRTDALGCLSNAFVLCTGPIWLINFLNYLSIIDV